MLLIQVYKISHSSLVFVVVAALPCYIFWNTKIETLGRNKVHIFVTCVSFDKCRLLGIGLLFKVNVTIKDSYKTRKKTYEISLPLVWMAGKSEAAVHNLKNEL